MIDEKEILNGILKGDYQAITILYQNCYPAVKKLILKNTGQPEEAEDIFQESLVVLYRKIKNEDFKLSCSLSTYIYSICRNMWLDKLRRKKRLKKLHEINNDYFDADDDLFIVMHKNEQYALFQKHLLQLGADCQKLLRLFFEGNDMKYIAREMNYKSVGYARKRKFKCKDKLIQNIQGDPVYKEITEGNSLDNQTIN